VPHLLAARATTGERRRSRKRISAPLPWIDGDDMVGVGRRNGRPRQSLDRRSRPHAHSPATAAFACLALVGCAAQQTGEAVAADAPGFLLGLWHGFIFPVAWIVSLFVNDVAVYAVPNNGGWYDFGYFLGIVVFGVGARKSKVVYKTRRVRG
jgi:hypothetical protein